MVQSSSPKFTRRNMLAESAAPLALTGLRPASATDLANVYGSSVADWQELREILGNQLYLPDTPGYGLKMLVNNMRYLADAPQAVAICSDAVTAAKAISWCAQHGQLFRTKGGGHSYAGYSAGAYLTLCTQGMQDVTWDGDLVTVGAGAINYSVYAALADKTRTMTHGRCPGVGVAGFALGGIGFDMRRFGVASDSLVSATAILADGREVTASATRNPDPSLTDWVQAYYGENLPQLKVVKATYDPQCLFDFQ